MTKLQFLLSLNEKLSTLPKEEAEERLRFYSEMIEDRMEEGLTEEEAVAAVGSVEEIAADVAPTKNEKPKRRLKTWEIVLLVAGSPIWFSLLVAAFAVALSLYVSLWAVIVSLWATFGAVAGCILGCIAAGIGFFLYGSIPSGMAMLGAGCVCAGVAIALFFGCKAATKGTVLLTKQIFTRKGGAQ